MAISAEQVAVVERKHPNLWSRSSWILSHTAAFFPSVVALLRVAKLSYPWIGSRGYGPGGLELFALMCRIPKKG